MCTLDDTLDRTRMERVLAVDDDASFRDLLARELSLYGYEIETVESAEQASEALGKRDYQVVLLDVMLPGKSGFELCRMLRSRFPALAIILLTSRASESDRVHGLELGADDYVVKPFSVRELVARIGAVVRRIGPQSELASGEFRVVNIGELAIDCERKRVLKNGILVDLTATEFRLVEFLALHAGTPFSREELLERVWGYQHEGYSHTVNTHINRVRIKLEDDPAHPRYLLTERGHGYRFVEQREFLGKQ